MNQKKYKYIYSCGDFVILAAGLTIVAHLFLGMAAWWRYHGLGGYGDPSLLVRPLGISQTAVCLAALIMLILGWRWRRDNYCLRHVRGEQDRFFNQLLSSVPDAICIFDRDLRIIRTNPVMEKWHSHLYPLVGQTCGEVFSPDSPISTMCQRGLELGAKSIIEVPIREEQQEIIGWERVSVYPLVDAESWQTEGVILVLQDISEPRMAQEALAQEKDRLEVTLGSLADGVIAIDNRGVITLANQAAAQLAGRPWEDLAGDSFAQVVHIVEEGPQGFEDIDLASFPETEGTVCLNNHAFISGRDGRVRRITATGAPLSTSDGQRLGMVWVFHDLTDLYHLEQELAKQAQLQSLGTLAGGIAHDFNNLLTTILGSISMALLQIGSTTHVVARLREAEEAGLRATGLAKKLLTFAEGGEPIKKIVSLKDAVIDATQLVDKNHRVRCEVSLPEDLWPVEADEVQISQVIAEVIKNSEQAMPLGGVIQVQAENYQVDQETVEVPRTGNYVCIKITDQGVGIAPEHLDKVFEPYFSTKNVGRGMGLAMAYSVIKNHQGFLSLTSERDTGTTCRICLPAISQEPAPMSSNLASLHRGQGKILLMDDESMILNTSRLMLEKLGYRVECARDGGEALTLYRQAREGGDGFDAVILDLTIPGGMGGADTIKELLALDPQVRAIVSSGYSDSHVMARYREYGFRGVIPKPYRLQNLSEALREVLVPTS